MMCRVVHEIRMATRHWRFADEDVDAEVYGENVCTSSFHGALSSLCFVSTEMCSQGTPVEVNYSPPDPETSLEEAEAATAAAAE